MKRLLVLGLLAGLLLVPDTRYRRRLGLFLWPPKTMCSDCESVWRERVRMPCRYCGSTRRTIGRFTYDGIGATEVVGA